MSIKEEIKSLNSMVEHKKIQQELTAYRTAVITRTNADKTVGVLLSSELAVHSASLLKLLVGGEAQVKFFRDFADGLEKENKKV